MNGRAGIDVELLRAWLRRLLPGRSLVSFVVTSETMRADLLLLVHHVWGLVLGLYWLDRSGLRRLPMHEDFLWQRVDPESSLYLLQKGDAHVPSAHFFCQ